MSEFNDLDGLAGASGSYAIWSTLCFKKKQTKLT
jgi:hypothetical protein